jgi:hypothetical protein
VDVAAKKGLGGVEDAEAELLSVASENECLGRPKGRLSRPLSVGWMPESELILVHGTLIIKGLTDISLRARFPLLHISTSFHLQGDDVQPGLSGCALLVPNRQASSGLPSKIGEEGAEVE